MTDDTIPADAGTGADLIQDNVAPVEAATSEREKAHNLLYEIEAEFKRLGHDIALDIETLRDKLTK